MDGALDALVKQLGSLDNVTADPKALELLGTLLKDRLDPVVDKWIEQNGKGLSEDLTKWVGAHPRTVVLTALLAAAGAIVANVSLPALKQKFKLGNGFGAEIEAKLGKIRQISLQSVRAKLTYESGPLLAAVSGTHDDKGTGGAANVTYKDGGRLLSADATFDGKGLNFVGINGSVNTGQNQLSGSVSNTRDAGTIAGVKLVTKDGQTTDTRDFQYNATSGIFSVGLGSVYSADGLTVSRNSRQGSDGGSSISQDVGFQSTEDGVTKGGYAGFAHESTKTPFGLAETDKIRFGLNYSRTDFAAKLDAAFASNGNAELSGSAKRTDGANSYGADFLFKDGDSKLWEAGAFYGFRSKQEFRSFVLDYRYKSDIDQNQVRLARGARASRHLPPLAIGGHVGWGQPDRARHVLQAARYMDDDTALIAGARYQKNFGTGQQSLNPQLGVQYKGIPVVAEYDTQNKGVMLRITIPFGR